MFEVVGKHVIVSASNLVLRSSAASTMFNIDGTVYGCNYRPDNKPFNTYDNEPLKFHLQKFVFVPKRAAAIDVFTNCNTL